MKKSVEGWGGGGSWCQQPIPQTTFEHSISSVFNLQQIELV